MSACRSCGRPVVWARTRSGKRIPLDPEERPDGNIAIDADSGRAVVVPPGVATKLHVSHFATCPDADSWRR